MQNKVMTGEHPALGKFNVIDSEVHRDKWGVETGKIIRITDIKDGGGGVFCFTDDYDSALNVSPIR